MIEHLITRRLVLHGLAAAVAAPVALVEPAQPVGAIFAEEWACVFDERGSPVLTESQQPIIALLETSDQTNWLELREFRW